MGLKGAWVVIAILLFAALTMAQSSRPVDQGDRFRPLPYAELTPRQKLMVQPYMNVVQAEARRRGETIVPYEIESKLMAAQFNSTLYVGVRSPEVTDSLLKMGYYLRTGAVPRKLIELSILLTARSWNDQFEWYSHRPQARQFGLSEEIIEAVAAGKRPASMQPDEEAVYNFCTELRGTRQVSDRTFEAVKSQLGSEQAVVELMATMSTWELSSMFHVVDRFPLPDGVKPELKPLE